METQVNFATTAKACMRMYLAWLKWTSVGPYLKWSCIHTCPGIYVGPDQPRTNGLRLAYRLDGVIVVGMGSNPDGVQLVLLYIVIYIEK